jgi:thioredoxin-related protein
VPVFRLRGFYPPYKFRAALQYVTEGFYKKEVFADYFLRATQGKFFLNAGLNERDFFHPAPYKLNKLLHHNKATAVFFEQGNCHACDLLHSGPLAKQPVIDEINKMNVIQLNMWKETPVITPAGEKTTAKKWAKSLNIFYTPSIIFFDEKGKEIIRVDSVTQFYRLLGVLSYVNKKGYTKSRDYQDWRLKQRKVLK